MELLLYRLLKKEICLARTLFKSVLKCNAFFCENSTKRDFFLHEMYKFEQNLLKKLVTFDSSNSKKSLSLLNFFKINFYLCRSNI